MLFLGLNLELSPQSSDALWASDSALKPETLMQAMTDLLQQAGIGHPENAWVFEERGVLHTENALHIAQYGNILCSGYNKAEVSADDHDDDGIWGGGGGGAQHLMLGL